MPFSAFTFFASTLGVPVANFSFPIGGVANGDLILWCVRPTGNPAAAITDNAGNVYFDADINLQGSANVTGNAALVVNFNNAVANNFDVVGIVISGLDAAPFDLEAFVREQLNPASVLHSTADPPNPIGFGGPINVVATNEVLLGFFEDNALGGGAITTISPLTERINTLGIAIGLSPAAVAPGAYNAIFGTALAISDCGVTLFSLKLAPSSPTGGRGMLAILGAGK